MRASTAAFSRSGGQIYQIPRTSTNLFLEEVWKYFLQLCTANEKPGKRARPCFPLLRRLMKRLFVAIKVEGSDSLLETYERFRKWFGKENITWSETRNFHITLKFIGDTTEDKIPAIRKELRKVASHYPSFSMNIRGTGVFGSSYKPRVIWFGTEDLSGVLAPLTTDIVGVLETLGFEDDRQNFVPHLTMGRIKYLRFKKKLEEKIHKFHDVEFQTLHVQSFQLFESEFGPEGLIYHLIEQFPLGKSSPSSLGKPDSSWWGKLLKRLFS